MKQIKIISCFIILVVFASCKKSNENPVSANEPPLTWQEHWFEHNPVVNRVFFNDDLAVYFDKDVNKSITWPNDYLTKVWQYTRNVYGDFGQDKRLFAIFHTAKYSGGHPSNYFEASHDNRNVIDVGLSDANAWVGFTAGEKTL